MCTEDDPRVHISLLGFSPAVKTCARAFICWVKKLPWKFLVGSQHKSSLAFLPSATPSSQYPSGDGKWGFPLLGGGLLDPGRPGYP